MNIHEISSMIHRIRTLARAWGYPRSPSDQEREKARTLARTFEELSHDSAELDLACRRVSMFLDRMASPDGGRFDALGAVERCDDLEGLIAKIQKLSPSTPAVPIETIHTLLNAHREALSLPTLMDLYLPAQTPRQLRSRRGRRPSPRGGSYGGPRR